MGLLVRINFLVLVLGVVVYSMWDLRTSGLPGGVQEALSIAPKQQQAIEIKAKLVKSCDECGDALEAHQASPPPAQPSFKD